MSFQIVLPYLVDPIYQVGDYKTADKINLILNETKKTISLKGM